MPKSLLQSSSMKDQLATFYLGITVLKRSECGEEQTSQEKHTVKRRRFSQPVTDKYIEASKGNIDLKKTHGALCENRQQMT